MSPVATVAATFTAALALIGGAAISTPAATPARDAHQCELRLEPHRGGTRITARVAADTAALSGQYRLNVTGRGVDIDQSGTFDLWPGDAAVLGEIELSAPPGGLRGALSLTVAGKRLPCPVLTAPIPL